MLDWFWIGVNLVISKIWPNTSVSVGVTANGNSVQSTNCKLLYWPVCMDTFATFGSPCRCRYNLHLELSSQSDALTNTSLPSFYVDFKHEIEAMDCCQVSCSAGKDWKVPWSRQLGGRMKLILLGSWFHCLDKETKPRRCQIPNIINTITAT